MDAQIEVRIWEPVIIDDGEFITQKSAAELVGMRIQSISHALSAGTLPLIKFGRTRGTTRSAVLAWVKVKGRWNKK